MAYIDPQFNVAITELPSLVQGTATASATDGVAVTAQLFQNLQALRISKVRVFVNTVPKTGNMGLIVVVKAGTATVATATMGTNTTAGSYKAATLTTNTDVVADTVWTAVVTGSATASGDTIGAMLVELQATPLFS